MDTHTPYGPRVRIGGVPFGSRSFRVCMATVRYAMSKENMAAVTKNGGMRRNNVLLW